MAFDKFGKHHMNPAHAKMADRFKKPAEGSPREEATEPRAEAQAEGDEDGGEGTVVLPKEDGSVHTEGHDGEHNEHESMHHALAHVAEKHGHPDLAAHIMAHHEGAEPEPMMAHSGGMGGY